MTYCGVTPSRVRGRPESPLRLALDPLFSIEFATSFSLQGSGSVAGCQVSVLMIFGGGPASTSHNSLILKTILLRSRYRCGLDSMAFA
jgi:hypothetical protein